VQDLFELRTSGHGHPLGRLNELLNAVYKIYANGDATRYSDKPAEDISENSRRQITFWQKERSRRDSNTFTCKSCLSLGQAQNAPRRTQLRLSQHTFPGCIGSRGRRVGRGRVILAVCWLGLDDDVGSVDVIISLYCFTLPPRNLFFTPTTLQHGTLRLSLLTNPTSGTTQQRWKRTGHNRNGRADGIRVSFVLSIFLGYCQGFTPQAFGIGSPSGSIPKEEKVRVGPSTRHDQVGSQEDSRSPSPRW
jgi:hypothetical protein